jgi:hypothetical protein
LGAIGLPYQALPVSISIPIMFRVLRDIGNAVRDTIAEGVDQHQRHRQQQQHHQEQQQHYHQQQRQQYNAVPPGGYYNNMNPYPYYDQTAQRCQQLPGPTPPSWPLLVNPDKITPTPVFARLLDAIFDLAQSADTNTASRDLLTPARLAAVYDELGYPPEDNLPLLLFRDAQNSGDNTRVGEGIQMAWRVFGLEYTTVGNVPGLTREGFKDLMVRDAIIFPPGQARAYNSLLVKHRESLSVRGGVFPAGEIGMGCFMPAGVPATGDEETQRVFKERQGVWGREYRLRFPRTQQASMVSRQMETAGGWGLAMQLENFKHDMTMDALTPGYAVPNGWGGYSYHYTGGLNW